MRAAETADVTPLGDDELDALFFPLSQANLIALAVSGGADSLALLDALDRWRRLRDSAPEVLVLTVDHRLRPGSRSEALAVVRTARARGMAGRILTREGAAPTADIEAAARTARYRLLIDACRQCGVSHLVLAHHRDDLAETFLIRLKRGAGVFGLAAMRPSLVVSDLTIVRPLLGVSRARLAVTAAAANLKPAVDPMNVDPRFERSRIRRVLPDLAKLGLDPASLAAAALRLADAADAIDAAATALIAEAVEADDFAVAWLSPQRFAAAPAEIALRALARIVVAVGGDDYPPRRERLQALAAAMAGYAGAGRFKRTLGGSVIEARGGAFAVYREAGRNGLPMLPIKGVAAGVWDHRFSYAVAKGAGVTAIGPLGEAGRRQWGGAFGGCPPEAVAALPAFICPGRAAGPMPALAPGAERLGRVKSLLAERLRRPPLFPDLSAGG